MKAKAGIRKSASVYVKTVEKGEAFRFDEAGKMLDTIFETYTGDLSEKVIRGMTENALKCKLKGGRRPMGYVIDADQYFQIDPLTAPKILEACKRYDEGSTMTEIMDWLNAKGMCSTRGRLLTYNSVEHLLKNRRYIGEYSYRDTVIPDGIPVIVPRDLFDRVQTRMAKNKKVPARHKAENDYLLTTKLFCGHCGAHMCGESGTSRTGVVYHYHIYDDKIVITFNYKESTKTVTLDEAKKAIPEENGSDLDCSLENDSFSRHFYVLSLDFAYSERSECFLLPRLGSGMLHLSGAVRASASFALLRGPLLQKRTPPDCSDGVPDQPSIRMVLFSGAFGVSFFGMIRCRTPFS